MISSDYRLIYIHVPKTGGNSIQAALLPYSDDQMRCVARLHDGIERFEVDGALTPSKHTPLANYIRVLGKKVEDYRIAITLRHPFDRALSLYFSPHRWAQRSADGSITFIEPTWDRDDFLEACGKLTPAVHYLAWDGHVVRPTYALRYDSLAQDFEAMVADAGLPPVCARLPQLNRSADVKGLRAELRTDAGLRADVERMFPGDLELLRVV